MESGLLLIRELMKVERGMAEFLRVRVGRDRKVQLRIMCYLL